MAATASPTTSVLNLFSFFNPPKPLPAARSPPSLFSSATKGRLASSNEVRLSPYQVVSPSPAYVNTMVFRAAYNVQVVFDDDEAEEKLLSRFRREVMRAGIIQECKRRRFFERKSREAARRNRCRTNLIVPLKSFFCQSKKAESDIDGSFSLRLVPATLLAAEKEEAKAVLTLFLKKQGLSNATATRTINKADAFLDHLVSRLHSVYKSRYLVGRELTTLEIRDALIPYLETLLEEYGDGLVDVVEQFPSPPIKKKIEENLLKQHIIENSVASVSHSIPTMDSRKLKALARVTDINPTGKLPSHIVYLLEFGMDLEAIREVICKFPAFAYYSLEGKIKPIVEFLLDLGVPKADIPTILSKRPQLCGISLTENLIPTMAFLEELGVDKKQWAKVIYRFPSLLTYSRQKLKATVDFLYEMGLSTENVSKVLTRCPNIISYSLEHKLQPTVDYFRSLGFDIALLLHRSPQTFGLSIESNLKPVTEFFLEKGYSSEDLATMVSRYGALYTFSLSENLMPKWEFFLTTVYPKSELVKFPQYFGYSLENRIKPRYKIMRNCGVKLLLNQMLSLSELDFHELLNKKMHKKVL